MRTHTCLRECLLHTTQLTKSPFPSRLVHRLSFRLLGNRKWHAVSITCASEQDAACSYCAVVVDGAWLEVFLPHTEARHGIAQFSYTERMSLRCPQNQSSCLHMYSLNGFKIQKTLLSVLIMTLKRIFSSVTH